MKQWLEDLLVEFEEKILDFCREEAQLWGCLRAPHYGNALDKQLAATALIYDLTLVARSTGDFQATGVKLLNPCNYSAYRILVLT